MEKPRIVEVERPVEVDGVESMKFVGAYKEGGDSFAMRLGEGDFIDECWMVDSWFFDTWLRSGRSEKICRLMVKDELDGSMYVIPVAEAEKWSKKGGGFYRIPLIAFGVLKGDGARFRQLKDPMADKAPEPQPEPEPECKPKSEPEPEKTEKDDDIFGFAR